MTVQFGNNRLIFYITVLLLSGTVLGLAAHLAHEFLPSLHRDFTIFSLIVPSITILVFLLLLQWAQARTEAIALFILGTLWLAMGAWATDIIGNVQCDVLGGQTIETRTGTMPAGRYCREIKVMQAFSWMNFVLFAMALIILISLVSRAKSFGRYNIWWEPIRELPWFGEAPGYYNTGDGGNGMPVPVTYPAMGGAYPAGYPTQLGPSPGQTIVIHPGINGQPPTITTVPSTA